ncbi:prepilin peptidase [Candidatus Kaiserbacteria bacterium]|nr:prepilin peptidase [Candidatus Kaiserbacteria bacterium]
MIAFTLGLFGLIVGSFLNVIILRHGIRSLGGRSGCMSCNVQLKWYDMVPVFSWALLGGRCRSCRGHISAQYPLVEGATGALFATLGFLVSPTLSGLLWSGIALVALYFCILAILICIAAYDMLHTIIPDEWAYVFAALAFISQFLQPFPPDYGLLWFFLAGPVAAAPLFALWLFSRGMWMGLGDAKLALGIGWLLGPLLGLFAVFGAFVIGAIVSVCVLLPLPRIIRALYTLGITSREKPAGGFTMKSEIPFGPFLILSCIIIWFASLYGIDSLRIFGLLPR